MDEKGFSAISAKEKQNNAIDRPFPKCIFFIMSYEFCEVFCSVAVINVLSVYLTDYLLYSERDATLIFHALMMLTFFCPIFGAIIADSFWGKLNTIVYISMVFVLGSTILSMSAIIPLNLPHRELTMVGLFCTAVGLGGIKPCVPTFGADQFILPQQLKYLSLYFSVYMLVLNGGFLFSSLIAPVLHANVHCFGEETCFPLAFAVPTVIMITSIAIISLGKPFYRCVPHSENLILKIIKCIWKAIVGKLTSKTKVAHWMDHASESFSKKFIDDVKQCLNVLFLFIPFPVEATLSFQTASAWVFQTRRMQNDLGFYTVPPDQMQILGPLIGIILIPILHYGAYPALNKLNLLRGLFEKITFGGVMVGMSFVASACVSLVLESANPKLPSEGVAHLRFYNTMPCDARVYCPGLRANSFVISQGSHYEDTEEIINGNDTLRYELTSSCGNFSGTLEIYERQAVGYYFENGSSMMFVDDTSKPQGLKVRTLINTNNCTGDFVNVTYTNVLGSTVISTNSSNPSLYDMSAGDYRIKIGDYEFNASFSIGGIYALLAVATNATHFEISIVEVIAPNNVNILWITPQYFLLTLGDTIFATVGLEFAYSQAPVNMKSLITAAWLLTIAVGNLIVVLVESLSIFELASHNFFFYAGLMFVDMVIFAIMTRRYRFVQVEDSPEL